MNRIQALALLAALIIPTCGGQSSDDQTWVESGRGYLEQKNLWKANESFARALALNPNNPDANVLQAATSLLILPQQAAGSNFLNRLGISASGRDLYNWTADFRRKANGELVLPNNLKAEEAINLYRNTVVPVLQAAQQKLARVVDVGYQLQLKAAEVPAQPVTIDWGDIQVVRALLHAGEFLGHTLNAHNFTGSFSHFFDLGSKGQLTVQRFLKDYPAFLKSGNAASLAASQNAFSNAVVQYVVASEFIRNPERRPVGAPRLFTLAAEDFADEAQFRNALVKVLVSTQRPVKIQEDDDFYVYARNYFSGTKPLRDLVPKFNGNYYLTNSLPSYSFGGVVPGLPPATTEMFLRDRLGPIPYSGYYLSRNIGGSGQAALLIQPDVKGWKVSMVGVSFNDLTCLGCGIWAEALVNADGSWSQTVPSWLGQLPPGKFSGQIEEDGNLYVRYQNPAPPGLTMGQVFEFRAKRQSGSGRYRHEAGLYSGNSNLTGKGLLRGLLLPSNKIFLVLDTGSAYRQGTFGYLDQQDHFFTAFGEPIVSALLDGDLDREHNTIAIQWQEVGGGLPNCVLTRVEQVPESPTVPTPTILTQPISLAAAAGAVATFSVQASGTPPLTYQWWFNDDPLPQETGPTLNLKPVQMAQAGRYTVLVANLGGLVISEPATLTVLPETVPPVASANIPANSTHLLDPALTITGTASDNSGVREVFYRLNAGSWAAASGSTSWLASVTLQGGSNVFEYKAIDEYENESAVKTMSLFLVAADWIQVEITGQGTVKPDYDGQRLELDKNYTLTAIPAAGYVIAGWTGSVTSSQPALTFRMASNLVLQANFVPDPYPAWQGTYSGLFQLNSGANERSPTNDGAFTITLTDRGQASGKLTLGNKTLSFSGVSFDVGGKAHFFVKQTAPATPLEFTLSLSALNGSIDGQVSSSESTGALTGFRQKAGGEWKGSYTFLIYPEASASPPFPPGAGAGTLTMDAQGRIKLVGTLGDGTAFTASSAWAVDGGFHVYIPLYSNKGLLSGRGKLVDGAVRLVGGNLAWKKPPTGSADRFYPEGFSVRELVYGSVYRPPARGQSALSWSEGQLELSDGNLASSQALPIKWVNNKLVVVGDNPLKCTATITASSGLIQGSIIHPATGKKTTFKGAVVQSLGTGSGWFLGTNQSGAFVIHSNAPANP